MFTLGGIHHASSHFAHVYRWLLIAVLAALVLAPISGVALAEPVVPTDQPNPNAPQSAPTLSAPPLPSIPLAADASDAMPTASQDRPWIPPLDKPTRASEGPAVPGLDSTFAGVNFDTNPTYNSGFLFIPPDPIAAAGPTHVVSVVNCLIEWRLKTGAAGTIQSLQGFFTSLTPVNSLFDPKVIYDQYNSRFVVVALERVDSGGTETSRILVAVSKTSDPTAGWWFTAINSKISIGGLNRWADYPGLAVDDKAVYITNNMFAFTAGGGGFGGVRFWIINKTPFYTGGAASVTVHDPYASAGIATTTQPAHMFGAPPGVMGTFLVSYSGLNCSGIESVQIVRVDSPLTTPVFTQQYVSLGDIDNTATSTLPDAPQLGSANLIEVNDRRALNAVWRNNILWTTFQILPASGPDSGQVTAHWVKLSGASLEAIAVADQGNVGGEDIATGAYTFFPSIAVDDQGGMAIGFAASASSIYAGAYYTGRLAGDPAGTVQASGTLHAGTDWYLRTFGGGRNRWGDYSGISLDPTNKTTFWLFNEYAMTRGTAISGEDGRWATQYGSFHLNLPLAVSLASFTAEPQAGSVRLAWETVSETNNAGFNLYRADNARRPADLAGLRALAGTRQHTGLRLHLRRLGRPAQPDLLVLAGGRQPRRRDDAAWAGQRDGERADCGDAEREQSQPGGGYGRGAAVAAGFPRPAGAGLAVGWRRRA